MYFELHNALMHENEKAKPHAMGSDRIKVFLRSPLPARDAIWGGGERGTD